MSERSVSWRDNFVARHPIKTVPTALISSRKCPARHRGSKPLRYTSQGISQLASWLSEDSTPQSPAVNSVNKEAATEQDLLSGEAGLPSGSGEVQATAVAEASALVSGLQQADSDSLTGTGAATSKPISKRRLWFMAIKPPMYSVSLVPILVSAAVAYAESGQFHGRLFAQLIVGAFCIIAWLNTSNDAFDAQMGVDAAKIESLVNITSNRLGCLWVANAFLALGLSLLGSAIWHAGDLRAAGALGTAIVLGYMYQGPPFRLSYKGLGEPLCFITFGPLSTCAFYLTQAAAAAGGVAVEVSSAILVASALVGITTATILFCSHFHQIEGDKAASKMSPLVRLGSTARGFQVLKGIVTCVYGLVLAASILGILPLACLPLIMLSLPQGLQLLSFCAANLLIPERVRPLKIFCCKWHTAFGAALAAGIAVPQLVSQLVVAF